VALTTLGLALASFMQVLDTTIANVSLPTISGNLGGSANQATWVITSFAVSTAIALPLTGWLARRFGERKLFVWSTMAFVIASFLCGIANSMGMLVVARALQGFVAGPMYPITQALLLSIYPPAKRGQAIALLAMVTVVAPIAGPILGGWITDNYSWEWIFFVNVPIGIFASLVVGRQLKGRPERLEKPKMDYIGLATLVLGVGALQILLDLGNDEDWFASQIVVLAIVAAISLAVFVIWELTDKDPIVNLRLFRHRNFAAGTLAMVVAYSAFFSVGILVPLWLQRNWATPRSGPGFATAPIGILPVLLTPFVGKYANALRPAHAGQRRVHRDVVHQLRALALQPRRRLRARGLECSCSRAWAWRCSSCRCCRSCCRTWNRTRSPQAPASRPSCAHWAAASPRH
jgi:DHA2 family multidrug resistance protein